MVAYQDDSDGAKGRCLVGMVSAGTTITYGTEVQFTVGNEMPLRIDLDFDNGVTDRCIITYADYRQSYKSFLIVGSLSGNSISFTGQLAVSSTTVASASSRLRFDKTRSGKFVVSYSMGGNLTFREGELSGTAVTLGSEVNVTPYVAYANTSFSSHAQHSAKMLLINNSTASLVSLTSPVTNTVTNYLTANNFVGISSSSYADSDTATITLPGGVASNLSGLTTGETYYVQPSDGSLGTTEGLSLIHI